MVFPFKADTNHTREEPAIRICQDLFNRRAELATYDPYVPESQIASYLGCQLPSSTVNYPLTGGGVWHLATMHADAMAQADADLILSEPVSFAEFSREQLAGQMSTPAWLFDASTIVDLAAGQQVWRVACG